MYVVKKPNHHNAVSASVERHGKMMEFSRCPISLAGRVDHQCSIFLTTYILDFIFCEV